MILCEVKITQNTVTELLEDFNLKSPYLKLGTFTRLALAYVRAIYAHK